MKLLEFFASLEPQEVVILFWGRRSMVSICLAEG